MFIHSSGVLPRAAASRMAMAAEIAALPLSRRERHARNPQMGCCRGHRQVSQIFAENRARMGWVVHSFSSSSQAHGFRLPAQAQLSAHSAET